MRILITIFIYSLTRVESHCPENTAELKINGLVAWLFTSPVAFMKLRGLPVLVGQITHLPNPLRPLHY